MLIFSLNPIFWLMEATLVVAVEDNRCFSFKVFALLIASLPEIKPLVSIDEDGIGFFILSKSVNSKKLPNSQRMLILEDERPQGNAGEEVSPTVRHYLMWI